MAKRLAKKILWIGWDGADWKVINPMIEKGYMPNLEKFINRGVMGNLATLDPPMSPTLWTAMSCGKRPYKHGIHGFTEVDPSGDNVRPCQVSSRKVRAIWNMMKLKGMKCHQVGWWPSHPAEPTNGIYISNMFQKANKNPKDWPLAPGAVHPVKMENLFANLRVHPKQLTNAHLQPFIRNLDSFDFKDQKNKKLLNSVNKITADAACIHNAVTWILENEKDWDLTCVYYDNLDHYSHGFMKYHPPRRPHIPEKIYKHFKDVVVSGYVFHDMMLGRLMDLVDDDTTVLLVSDHGFHPDHLRPKQLPLREEPAAPALEHSPYGIIVAAGPGIKKDERIYGASLIDMCPTILSMLGLPVAKDFDGKVLMNMFEQPVEVDVIDSWEDIEGEDGQHPKDLKIDPEAAKAELQQLIDLGYIEDPGPNKEAGVERTKQFNNYFLARAFVNGGRQEDALPLFEQLWEENRDNYRFGIRLANCYMALDMLKEARQIVNDIFELKLEDSPNLNVLSGTLYLKEKKFKKAVKEFEKAYKSIPKSPNISLQLGQGYFRLRQYKKAKEAIERELQINYENPEAHRILGEIEAKAGRFENAVEYFLNSIGLRYHSPMSHYGLAEALFRMEDYENAAQAFEVALAMFPKFDKARNFLIRIYKHKLDNPDRVAELEKEHEEIIAERKTLTIVSGFKRSGTSDLMYILEAGGANIIMNAENFKDEFTPNGNYELAETFELHHNKKFLKKINENQVFKVYASQLPFLPNAYNYDILFVDRPLEEIIENRNTIKVANKIAKAGTANLMEYTKLTMTAKRVEKWLEAKPNVEFVKINYKVLIEDSFKTLEEIVDFAEIDLALDKMAEATDALKAKENISV